MSMKPCKNGHSEFEDHLYVSRAVKVNGDKAPLPFIHALAVGRVEAGKYDKHETLEAVVNGFLKPEQSLESTLVSYTNQHDAYVIGNHLQASCYHADLQEQAILFEKPFNSAADVLLEVIPSIRLHNLMSSFDETDPQFLSKSTTKSDFPLPYEECWNTCFRDIFGRGSGTPKSTKKNIGMPDLKCQHDDRAIIIETVMSYQNKAGVQKHADRFCSPPKGMESYQPTTQKGRISLRGLVVIGENQEEVTSLLKQVQLDEANKDLEVMGLCPLSGYHSMRFIRRTTDNRCQQYTIPCIAKHDFQVQLTLKNI